MKEKITPLTLRLPDDLRREIRRLAGAADMSMTQWIVNALRQEVDRKKREERN